MFIFGVRNKFIFFVRRVIKQEIKFVGEGGGEVFERDDRGVRQILDEVYFQILWNFIYRKGFYRLRVFFWFI